jgi:hypothetical protein
LDSQGLEKAGKTGSFAVKSISPSYSSKSPQLNGKKQLSNLKSKKPMPKIPVKAKN